MKTTRNFDPNRMCVEMALSHRPQYRFAGATKADFDGVAPIYRPYKLACRFVQKGIERIVESADIRTWMPEEPTWFSETIAMLVGFQPGDVGVSVGIIDPLTCRPVVRFAIEETGPLGWHLLTSMDVIP